MKETLSNLSSSLHATDIKETDDLKVSKSLSNICEQKVNIHIRIK